MGDSFISYIYLAAREAALFGSFGRALSQSQSNSISLGDVHDLEGRGRGGEDVSL